MINRHIALRTCYAINFMVYSANAWGWFWIRRDSRNPRCMPRCGRPR